MVAWSCWDTVLVIHKNFQKSKVLVYMCVGILKNVWGSFWHFEMNCSTSDLICRLGGHVHTKARGATVTSGHEVVLANQKPEQKAIYSKFTDSTPGLGS